MKKSEKELISFFCITFAFTWSLWILKALAVRGLLGSSILVDFLGGPNNPAAFGPFVGAVLLTWWNERGKGVVRLLKRGVDFGFGKVWLIPTFLLWPGIMGGALAISILTGEGIPELLWVSNPLLIVFYFFLNLINDGPLEEEFGWRGYALDGFSHVSTRSYPA